MRFTLVWRATDILIAILLIKALAVLNLHCKSSSFQSERYSSFWMSNSFNSLHKICILLREQAETQHYLSPKSHKTCSVLSLILSNVSPPKNHACQPLWLSHCSTTSQNFTILTQELRGQTLTGHQICDTAELWFKVTAYLCDGSLQYRARDFTEKYSSPSESSCSTEQLCTPHHDLPSFHRDPLGVNSLRMSLSCVPDLEKLWLLDHHHIWMHMDTISSP